MTAARNLIPSREAEWNGLERCWASIDQYPPRKDRSSWWLVLGAAALVGLALAVLR